VVGRPAALVSDESALEVCIRDDALYKLTIFTIYLFDSRSGSSLSSGYYFDGSANR